MEDMKNMLLRVAEHNASQHMAHVLPPVPVEDDRQIATKADGTPLVAKLEPIVTLKNLPKQPRAALRSVPTAAETPARVARTPGVEGTLRFALDDCDGETMLLVDPDTGGTYRVTIEYLESGLAAARVFHKNRTRRTRRSSHEAEGRARVGHQRVLEEVRRAEEADGGREQDDEPEVVGRDGERSEGRGEGGPVEGERIERVRGRDEREQRERAEPEAAQREREGQGGGLDGVELLQAGRRPKERQDG